MSAGDFKAPFLVDLESHEDLAEEFKFVSTGDTPKGVLQTLSRHVTLEAARIPLKPGRTSTS